MKLGISVVRFETNNGPEEIGPAFADYARRADQAGFDSLWVMDHFFQLPMIGPIDDRMLEGYAALAFAAGVTDRIKLGTMVTGVTYRQPGVLVKQVTTLDVLSGGRAYFGIGAGWFEREHAALGVPFPSTSERFERLEETVQIARQMWSDETGPFSGKHYQLAETINQPQAVSRPHPPILIGGTGEKKTLRLVAQYADACNLGTQDLGELALKVKVLRRHCEELGRPLDEIEKTTLVPLVAPDPESPLFARFPPGLVIGAAQAVDLIGSLRELGIDHFISPGAIEYPEMIDVIASEVMPHIAREAVAA